jgi:hypothetical protein
MKRLLAVIGTAAAAAAAVGAFTVGAGADRTAASPSSCGLNGPVKHVIYVVFDNTHYRRDRPTVASDLEQMPHLLNFLKSKGTVLANDHTVLISHTADGILTSLTGLYPDRSGMPVGNSYGFYRNDGATGFSSSFKYWTDPVDATFDPKPNMITSGGKNTPAPWVPFTRAGCDVGGVGTANIELENTATNASGDITKVFGTGSPEFAEATTNPALAQTDFVGIAIHCGNASTSRCASNPNAKDDLLPDEPGGYTGFKGLFGTKYVDPAITGGNPCVNDTTGNPIKDPAGNCGFPGFDGMFAANTLGYVAQMQENGVPVTYGYISDAHDCHAPNVTSDSYVSTAQGPGESCAKAQLDAYDQAFAFFFSTLAAHEINKSNTLFVFTADEGDHFAGGNGAPQPDGTLAYSHSNCAVMTACPGNQIGEVNANLQLLAPAGSPSFAVHSDDAPTVYVAGNPGRTDPTVRKLERDFGSMSLLDTYNNNGQATPITQALADPVEERALHMLVSDPNRTPTFTLFGNPDFFFNASPAALSCGANPCVAPGFAWNHGDVQEEIGNNWLGMVGPGVQNRGIDGRTWTDHANVRPTILALAGLKDDYLHDGRVLMEALDPKVLPPTLTGSKDALPLAQLYEKLNAPFQQFSRYTLAISTKALESTDETKYNSLEDQITALTKRREYVAGKIKTTLERATFLGKAINPKLAARWLAAGQKLLDDAAAASKAAA